MVRASILSSLVAAAAAAVSLAADSNGNTARKVVPGVYIFELEDGHDPTSFEQSIAQHGKTRMKLDYELFKGISVQLHDPKTAHETVAKLTAEPAVKAAFPVTLYDMPNPKVEWVAQQGQQSALPQKTRLFTRADNKTDVYPPHVMTQIDKLHNKGITGKGVKIAIVDTGIDYKHPALGGCFGKGCLVSFGTDFVGDLYNGVTNTVPQPDPDPMDCAGHGSHVAGIIAAQPNMYGFTGAAPGATLGAYRVFGCSGSVGNDVLLAAFNQAYQDGANIITASLGGANGWSEDVVSVTVSRIVDKGVPCTISAGNDGALGLFYGSSPASGRHVFDIASFDSVTTPSLVYKAKYQVDSGPETEFNHLPSDVGNWDGVTLPVWASNFDTTVKNDGCNPFPANTPDLSKYITLIHRGTCPFAQKVNNAVAKGAKYVIIYNTGPGTIDMDLSAVPAGAINAASMVDANTGANFIQILKSGKKLTLTMSSAAHSQFEIITINNNVTGGALSTYTSWGPGWEMDSIPQFGTVGGNILSSYPRAKGSYAVLSGTSMACPQAAGIVALIHEVRGTFEPDLIQNLLSANANPQRFNDGVSFYDFLAPVPQQGAGIVQAYDAAYAKTILAPSSLSFNDTDHFVRTLKFTLKNTDSKQVTYKISHVPAITMYALTNDSIYVQSFPNEAVKAAATLRFSDTSITLRGGESKTINVSPTPPQGLNARRLAVWSGYIAVNGTDGTSLSLPYQGLTGSLYKSAVLGPNDTFISNSTDTTAPPLPPNTTFLLPGPGNANANDSLPQLSVALALGSPNLRAYIIPLSGDAAKNMTTQQAPGGVGKTIGQPYGFPAQYVPRAQNNFPWDGRLDSGNYAPPGMYKFVVRALHVFGNQKREGDWDVSTGPAFSIKYK